MKRKNEDTHPRVQWRGWISETKSEESCLYSSMSDTQKSEMVWCWKHTEITRKIFLKMVWFLITEKKKQSLQENQTVRKVIFG